MTALLLAAVLIAGCSPHKGGNTGDTVVPAGRPFPQVSVPSLYSDDVERVQYIVSHYWDAFLNPADEHVTDSLGINGVAMADMELAVSSFILLLDNVDLPAACKAVDRMAQKMDAWQDAHPESGLHKALADMVSRYMYDPNSPVRNEDYYTPFAIAMAASQHVPQGLKASYTHDAQMSSLNRVGTRAADIRFRDIRGRDHHLYEVKAPVTLLFFSNPGCEACKEIIDALMLRTYIIDAIHDGRLAVVNVYIDEEVDRWRGYQKAYPLEWLNGYDPTFTIRTDLTYSIRAIPSLYLLDADKKVLMKDAPQQKVLEWLDNNI